MAVEDSVAQDQIRAFVERIERMEEEKAALASDIREIYQEAKGNGFDTKILRRVVSIRKQDANARMEQEALLELYMGALGMIEAPPSYDEERDRLNSLASKIEADLRKPKAEPTPDPIAALKTNPDLHIVSVSEIKPNQGNLQKVQNAQTASQPLTQAGSDLASPQAPGQVATQSPETADEAVERRTGNEPSEGGSVEAGVTGGESAATKYAAPGVITWEIAPPEGVKRGVVSAAFGNIGQDAVLIKDDLASGRAQPIVKIGNEIIDGFCRFMTARGMTQSVLRDGVPTEEPLPYAVMQYAGDDPLIDAIKLNVEGRVLSEREKLIVAKRLADRPEFKARKDDIYKAFELWMEPV